MPCPPVAASVVLAPPDHDTAPAARGGGAGARAHRTARSGRARGLRTARAPAGHAATARPALLPGTRPPYGPRCCRPRRHRTARAPAGHAATVRPALLPATPPPYGRIAVLEAVGVLMSITAGRDRRTSDTDRGEFLMTP